MIRQRVRIRFSKQGDLRMISHRDLVRTFERLMRRAALPLGMSQGFHPKARLSFPSALALGIASLDEVLEFEITEPLAAEEISRRLAAHAPAGLAIGEVRLLEPNERKARLRRTAYRIPIPAARQGLLEQRISQLAEQQSYWIQRDAGEAPLELKAALDQLDFHNGALEFRLEAPAQGGIRARDVLQALEIADLEQEGCCLTRSEVEIEG